MINEVRKIRSLANPTSEAYSIIVGGPLLILRLLYYFGTVGLNRSDMLSFFSMVLPMRLCSDGLAITLSSLPPETRDVAARDSGDK